MQKHRRTLFIILGLLVVLIVTPSCGSSSEVSTSPTEPSQDELSISTDNETQSTNTPQGIETEEPTPIPPSPTPLPMGLSRSNPYPKTELVNAPNWDIQVLEVVRGDAAWQAIKSENQFNDPAPEGMEYLMVKIHAKCTYADSDTHMISGSDFDITGDRLIKYSQAPVVDPEPALDAELYSDGETEGWVSFLVGQGEGNLILIFDELLNWDEDRFRFIALDDGASISVSQDLAGISPTDLGEERNSPAPVGETVITENWKVNILEAARGDEVWSMVQAANQFNDPPAEGMEYVALKVHVQNIGTEDIAEQIDGSYFSTTGSANTVYDNPSVVDPDPALDAYLFPGGETEGWVVLQVAKDETGIMVIFEPLFTFSNEDTRFMYLEP